MNICTNCTQLYCCKLADKTLASCPVFGDNPPENPPTHKQLWFPELTWEEKEGQYL